MYKFDEIKEHLHSWEEKDGCLVKEIFGYKVKLLLFDRYMIIVVKNDRGLPKEKIITKEDYDRYGNRLDLSDHIYKMALDLCKIELLEIKSKVWET